MQQSLDSFGFSCTPRPAQYQSESKVGSDIEMLDIKRGDSPEIFNLASFPPPDIPIWQETPETCTLEFDFPIRKESTTPAPLFFDDEQSGVAVLEKTPPAVVQIHEESITPPCLSFDDEPPSIAARKHLADEAGLEDDGDVGLEKDAEEMWEDEIEDMMQPRSEIRSWGELREQIKMDLNKKHSHLPLSQINQLMIIQNFANLRLKGFGRIEASHEIAHQWHEKEGSNVHFAQQIWALERHYQVFEQLLIERRGGAKSAKSLLKDEGVQVTVKAWLTEQKVGSITLQNFCNALNDIILPSLGVSTQKPLCERMAWHWLMKLGWTWTILRKGVYMDGHERPDVVAYHQNVFLLKMKEFEHQMARYEGPELRRIEPDLQPGEKELISEFQDESCCQQNDFVPSLWQVLS